MQTTRSHQPENTHFPEEVAGTTIPCLCPAHPDAADGITTAIQADSAVTPRVVPTIWGFVAI